MSREELQELVSDFRKTLLELKRMGCEVASSEACAPAIELAPEAEMLTEVPSAAAPATGTILGQIREELGDCQRCALSDSRTKIVFGCGSPSAALMFIGHAPNAEEDAQGEPFVGKAGQLLDKMIVAMGWQRESVYIAKVVKCRPADDREPTREHIEACRGFLAQQIEAVAPQVIVTLGKAAAQSLLGVGEKDAAIRGSWQEYAGIPVMPTYHPDHLLREPAKKRDAWADLQEVMKRLESLGIRAAP